MKIADLEEKLIDISFIREDKSLLVTTMDYIDMISLGYNEQLALQTIEFRYENLYRKCTNE